MKNSTDCIILGCGPSLKSLDKIGVKSIKTIGWDLGPPGDRTRSHFYSHDVMAKAHPMSQKESESKLTLGFYNWLNSKGISLSICSDSYAHKDIPRNAI